MKQGKGILLLFALLLSGKFVPAQDILVRTNNDSLKVKVLEVGTDKIKFRRYGVKTGPPLEIYKNNVKEIIFENGTRVTILYDLHSVSPDLALKEKKHGLKVDFIAPVLNHITIGYEQMLKPGMNAEIKAAYIGPRISTAIKPSTGYFIKGGIKFVWLTEEISKGLRHSPPLQGSYFKPELIYSRYTTNSENGKIKFTNLGFNILFGRQYIIDNFLTLDYFGGVGFALQYSTYKPLLPKDTDEVDFNYAFSHLYFGKNLPLILGGGLTIGFIY
ncbi:MAG: hypothetical protein ABI763_10395 [Bacteroidota bacterium]